MDRLLSAFSLARRAGALVIGFDAVIAAVRGKKNTTVFACCDMSEKTLKRLKQNTEVIILKQDMAYFGQIFKKPVGIFGVTDENFTGLILKNLEELGYDN